MELVDCYYFTRIFNQSPPFWEAILSETAWFSISIEFRWDFGTESLELVKLDANVSLQLYTTAL